MNVIELFKYLISKIKEVLAKLKPQPIEKPVDHIADNILDNISKPDTTITPDEKPDETPTTTDFPILYYINPEEEVNGKVDVDKYLETLDFSFFKKIGVTDLLVRTTSTGYSTDGTRPVGIKYTKLPAWKQKCDEHGLRLHAWVWNKFPYTKQVSEMGVHTHIDIETYYLTDEHAQVEKLREDSTGMILGVCTKPDGWDGDQAPEMLCPHVDYIAPMVYVGDYNTTINNLVAKVKEYQQTCPGKIIPILETYESDNNPIAKSEEKLLVEIESVKPYSQGVALFRYDKAGKLSKFRGLKKIITDTINTIVDTVTNVITPTDTFKPDDDGCYTCPRYLKDWRMKQDTDVWCALNAIQQVLYELTGKIVEENVIYDDRYTGAEGTAPEGLKQELLTQASKLGINIKIESFPLSKIEWGGIAQAVADPKKSVFFHEMYKDTWGHYDFPVSICPINVYMANSLQGEVIGYSKGTMQSWFNGISGNSIYVVTSLD